MGVSVRTGVAIGAACLSGGSALASFSFDDIGFWVGSGANAAAYALYGWALTRRYAADAGVVVDATNAPRRNVAA